jgi:dihydroorotase
VTLRKQEWVIPAELPYGERTLVPLAQGETLGWRLVE